MLLIVEGGWGFVIGRIVYGQHEMGEERDGDEGRSKHDRRVRCEELMIQHTPLCREGVVGD
jgi:hypothetical protein